MPLHLKVVIYNSAGEEVKVLYSGSAQDMAGSFTVDPGAVIPGSQGAAIIFGGFLQTGTKNLVWYGDNANGQAVSGGTYTIKTEMVDSFGSAQTHSQPVSVMPQAPTQSLNIYNSAGELVRTLGTGGGSSNPMTQLGFRDPSKTAFALGGSGVEFVLKDSSGSQLSSIWDGRSNSGAMVKSGSYTVQLVDNSSGHAVLVSKGFVLLADPAASAFDAVIGPNPAGPADAQLVVALKGQGPGAAASVKLFNLAGELVAQGAESAGSGKIILKLGNWSSGIYVASVESREGGALLKRKIRRIAIQR